MRKTGRKIRLAVAAGIAATAMTGAMAHAAAPPDDGPDHKTGSGMEECPTNRVCFYAEAEFNNGGDTDENDIWTVGRSWPYFNQNFEGSTLSNQAQDRTESIVNNTDHPVHVFDGWKYGGECLTIKPRSWVTDLADYHPIGRAVNSNAAASMSTDPMFTNHCYPAYKS
ncbi:hypothetical protein FHX42_000337 [Saccharopolyspora lacisalsi]|uniref:Peptidase inhibitor family I36 n=1 Tax=Halosaccharopolyspora lacisalsi TaxID=1000566 RepID=A0A839DW49_9PSEU|nr:peptidase inhibitor family I36 protein [Halosaccharopolyspora lacisalsi]MBA8823008.1 hypothetical protein [Halosaccharopolyspora lacisalsi]